MRRTKRKRKKTRGCREAECNPLKTYCKAAVQSEANATQLEWTYEESDKEKVNKAKCILSKACFKAAIKKEAIATR
jgi:hypothetical protein